MSRIMASSWEDSISVMMLVFPRIQKERVRWRTSLFPIFNSNRYIALGFLIAVESDHGSP